MHFWDDPINYIWCNFQLVIRMFNTNLMPAKIVPAFGVGSGFYYSFPDVGNSNWTR